MYSGIQFPLLYVALAKQKRVKTALLLIPKKCWLVFPLFLDTWESTVKFMGKKAQRITTELICPPKGLICWPCYLFQTYLFCLNNILLYSNQSGWSRYLLCFCLFLKNSKWVAVREKVEFSPSTRKCNSKLHRTFRTSKINLIKNTPQFYVEKIKPGLKYINDDLLN